MLPRIGMFAFVRNRPAVVTAVEPWQGADHVTTHLVDLQYKDGHLPWSDKVIWEREVSAQVLPMDRLPDFAKPAMVPEEYDALVRSARWSALLPFSEAENDREHVRDVYAPFFGAVQVEEYQLVPLYKALQMPRINMLIADDVGLGKTIEAGLIVTELLRRRRVQRVLVLCPAALRLQWRDEMRDKFALEFDVVDRASTEKMRRELGPDANPWRSSNRIIASYHYLRQPDIQEQFHASAQAQRHGGPLAKLPWDLLIVDECHHLMPSPLGQDSDLCEMLRRISSLCEHRIFLSATPHNGHTRSFTGLLEMLDPVQFTQSGKLRDAEKNRLSQVVVRRLKSQINERTNPPRFCHREPPKALDLALGPLESAVHVAFESFRSQVRAIIARERSQGRQRAGWFAVEILGKRLLSCPTAFAESWFRYLEGMTQGDAATEAAVLSVDQEVENDLETNAREVSAATVVGAWLRGFASDLKSEVHAVTESLTDLGFTAGFKPTEFVPREDSRFDQLSELIETRLRSGKAWSASERLVVFTEFKTTLDYLRARLERKFRSPNALDFLFGGMDDSEREKVKVRFNDDSSDIRILLATDAASEGLNLQRSARLLLHWDCPWNPSRIEQRNGRLDRHGQPRNVETFHFISHQNADLRFLALLIEKVDQIRSDLGSMAEVLDRAVHRGLVQGQNLQDVQGQLVLDMRVRQGQARYEADTSVSLEEARLREASLLDAQHGIDLDGPAMRSVLETAMSMGTGLRKLSAQAEGLWQLPPRIPEAWKESTEALRRLDSAMPGLAFDANPFMVQVGPRQVFAPRTDAVLMHLGHPLLKRAIQSVGARRYPSGQTASRWTIRRGGVPVGAQAMLLLTLEEIASNELHETVHHWVRTLAFPVINGKLGTAVEILSPLECRVVGSSPVLEARESDRDLLGELEEVLKTRIKKHRDDLQLNLQQGLAAVRSIRETELRERLQSRQGELSNLIENSTRLGLERELDELQDEISIKEQQASLFEDDRANELRIMRQDQKRIEEELIRRKSRLVELRELMGQERSRILDHLLPKRYSLSGSVSIFPVALELRLPEGVMA
jgi:hypothetical protein